MTAPDLREAEREAFEEWLRSTGCQPGMLERDGAVYLYAEPEWTAWRARAAIESRPTEPTDEQIDALADELLLKPRLGGRIETDIHAKPRRFARALIALAQSRSPTP